MVTEWEVVKFANSFILCNNVRWSAHFKKADKASTTKIRFWIPARLHKKQRLTEKKKLA